MAGYNARTFTEAPDKVVSLVMLQAYNDWHIDEWCGAAPDRFIPLAMVPMWDVELAVQEVHRVAKKGCRAISFLEAPHSQGLPSILSGYWDPMFEAIIDEDMVLCLHIGGAGSLIQLAAEAPSDHSQIIPSQITMLTAQDLLFGPTFRKYPALKVAFSEGGIGWIPFYLDRVDRHFKVQKWQHNDFGGKLPSEVFREHSLACYISDPSGIHARHLIGVDIIAWECDYPHTDTTWPESPELVWDEFTACDVPDDEIHQITWQNACRFFDFDPFTKTPREQATVGALRARSSHVDTTRMSKAEWRARNELAGIGVQLGRPQLVATGSHRQHEVDHGLAGGERAGDRRHHVARVDEQAHAADAARGRAVQEQHHRRPSARAGAARARSPRGSRRRTHPTSSRRQRRVGRARADRVDADALRHQRDTPATPRTRSSPAC